MLSAQSGADLRLIITAFESVRAQLPWDMGTLGYGALFHSILCLTSMSHGVDSADALFRIQFNSQLHTYIN